MNCQRNKNTGKIIARGDPLPAPTDPNVESVLFTAPLSDLAALEQPGDKFLSADGSAITVTPPAANAGALPAYVSPYAQSSDLQSEFTARQSGDTATQQSVTSEATARQNADTTLGNRATALEARTGDATTTTKGVTWFAGDGAATDGRAVQATDARLSNARTPLAHKATHGVSGSDPIAIAASQVSGLAAVATTGNYTDLSNKPATLPPNGTAGGVLAGSYPNPTLVPSGVTAGTYALANGGSLVVGTDGRITGIVAAGTASANTPFGAPRVVIASGNISATEGYLRVPTTVSASLTQTLPTAPTNGQQVLIENLSNTSQIVAVASGSGQSILQPNSSGGSAVSSYQAGGGVCITLGYETGSKIWKVR